MSTSSVTNDVTLGADIFLGPFVNLYGCTIGTESRIGAFVEIQKNATIGHRCKIQSHSFICEGVVLEDGVFVGHGVMFINDLYPRATGAGGAPLGDGDWTVVPTRIRKNASIGSNSTILAGVTVGEGALVGAGSVVTRDIPAYTIVAGNPAKILRKVDHG